jgi:2-polyprenyl-3-methyl-5-hydroxy-6-metoxy-1,4-benzoquinol methylase
MANEIRGEVDDCVGNSRASREFWDSQWREGKLPRAVNPQDRSLKNYTVRKFDVLFRKVFGVKNHSPDSPNLLELGCARSAWLPYFSKEFGFRVAGIDYSSLGCDQAQAILAMESVEGDVSLADVFVPPRHLLNRFDYVVSFGLVEHFEATDQCIRSCGAYLKSGGTMVTVIPNMNGLVGTLQKLLAREVYDVHVPLDTNTLRRAHEIAGLKVVQCEYFCFLNLGVLNLNRIRKSFLGLWLSRALNAVSAATWILESTGVRIPVNKLTSPYVICVSTKAATSALVGG